VLGTIVSLILGAHFKDYAVFLLPITAGGFLYIVGADLIPELQHEAKLSESIWQLTLIILGIGIMALLAALE
jgi:zinc and cadmium transporter